MAETLFTPWILGLFFLIAVLYSSVGHGGATGYLGLFAFLGAATAAVVPVALVLNMLVAGTGFYIFRRKGYFSWTLLAPFVAASIPAAFLGGMLRLEADTFRAILGVVLLAAGLRMAFIPQVTISRLASSTRYRVALSVGIGLTLGIISGMVGIGGGVFLSPIIMFLGWADARQTAAVSSAFIVLNSLSGLLGQITKGNVEVGSMWLLAVIVFIGALVGSSLGARQTRVRRLQVVLGVVLLGAGGKMIAQLWV
ncbi:MAG: sulfite exporter TauE/SafE family protein [Bacteroidia bacterium]|nr:sulfite exporter TauE/SafE family protein [Bacteroidia bacterium]